jgi:LuxR family maltose regulon positive regulatory protein
MKRALALVDSAAGQYAHERGGEPGQLLETKLYAPPIRPDVVARPRLADAIRTGPGQKLTVVVAPAGFGKTTLLAGWLAGVTGEGMGTAWVSLDPSENEPTLFWRYVIGALQKIDPGVGDSALSQLHSSHPPPIEAVLRTLINEVDAAGRDFTIVFDDYHVIDAAPIHTGMTFLLDRLPRRMHIVIASRSDPPLALHRMRARGELAELRVDDMRFTPSEASAFLNQVMSLGLSPAESATLEQRTEGWIAGLKLAALSMKGKNARKFVDGFSGDNRYIAEYLVEEVLRSEPEHVRNFLLSTAILDRMSGPLCDAVTAEQGSAELLEDLERRNLFVVPLDGQRQWYRYHHLFADVLRKLTGRDPDRARDFHQRASIWYEANASPGDAIRYALQAGDFARAAQMLEYPWPEKDRSYESRQWLDRVKSLPADAIRARPLLNMGYAWALLNSGELEAAEARLDEVEEALASMPEPGILAKELASARVYLTQSRGDLPETLEHARRALAMVADGDDAGLATGTALVALALWGRGELDAAHDTFAQALAIMGRMGHEADVIRGEFVLGDIRAAQGRLREAARIYEHGLKIAAAFAGASPPDTDQLHAGLSEVHREWNQLTSASELLDAVGHDGARVGHLGHKSLLCTAKANLRVAVGDYDGALELLDEAEQHVRLDPIPRAQPIAAIRARVHIAQGNLELAEEWAARSKVSANDDLSFLGEYKHVTLARLMIKRSEHEGAERLLDRLKTAARTGGRKGSVIEIMVLQSLVAQATGNMRGALDLLGEALTLGEPDGFLRVFLDEGPALRDLLRHATTRGLAGAYTRHVLAMFDARPLEQAQARAAAVATAPDMVTGSAQALTTRELEILRLIAAGLRNQEIADHLSISAATVKRHIANAYGKLGSSHRTAALARAKELKLL